MRLPLDPRADLRGVVLGALVVLGAAAPLRGQHAPQQVLDELDITTYEVVYTHPQTSRVRVVEDVVFTGSGETALTADLYLPPESVATRPVPVVIFVNGVGVRNFNEWGQYRTWPRLVAATGLAAVTYQTSDSSRASADLDAVVTLVHTLAPVHAIDPGRIALWACSGNVSAALPYAMGDGRPWLRAAVLYYGSGEVPVIRADLPLLFVRSGHDHPGLNQAINALAARALEINAPWMVINAAGSPHGFDVLTNSAEARGAVGHTLAFLADHLRLAEATPPPLSAAHQALIHQFGQERELALSALAALAATYPQTAQLWSRLGQVQIVAGRWSEAAASLEKAVSLGSGGGTTLYNLACAYARSGKSDRAIEALTRAFAAGFADRGLMARDDDLASLRGDPRFEAMLAQ